MRAAVVIAVSAIVALILARYAFVDVGGASPPRTSGLKEVDAAQSAGQAAASERGLNRVLVHAGVSIRVVDEEGVAVVGARITRIVDGVGVDDTVSRSDGRVLVDPRDSCDYWVVRHAAYAPLEVPYSEVVKAEEVVLKRCATLDLKVVDGKGESVAGATIRVRQVSPLGMPHAYECQSDDQGQALLEGMRSGAFRLEVTAPGMIAVAYEVGASLPASGRVRMLRPLVAIGECTVPIDSYKARFSRTAIEARLTPAGIAQGSIRGLLQDIRNRHPRAIAMAVAANPREVPEGSCVQVSYLANGSWGYVELPFRSWTGVEDIVRFSPSVEAGRGELVKLTLRDPTGATVPMGGLRMVFTPQGAEGLAHPVYVTGDEFQARLPRGRYKFESKTSSIQQALPETFVDIDENTDPDAAKVIAVTLTRHIMSVRLDLADPSNRVTRSSLDAGAVGVISDDGPQDVRHFPERGLSQSAFMLLEGWNTIRVFDANNNEKTYRVLVSRSGSALLREDGKLHDS